MVVDMPLFSKMGLPNLPTLRSREKFWTFRDRERAGMHSQMGIYFLISVSNLCLNTLIVYFGVDVVGLHYLVAQIIASLLIACGSFFIYQRFVFRPTSV